MAKEKSFLDWILYGVLSLILAAILGFISLVLYSLISLI
jgi:5-bromo-4-chloroindolyl phosphate hydrolysis protein